LKKIELYLIIILLIPGIPLGLISNKIFSLLKGKNSYDPIEELFFFIMISSIITWLTIALLIILMVK